MTRIMRSRDRAACTHTDAENISRRRDWPSDNEAERPSSTVMKRLIAWAMEFYQETGEKISAHNEQQRLHESPYQFCYFVLTDDRKTLYDRIDERVDLMLEQGLVAEVQALKEQGCRADMVSMKGLGYKEILAYLDGQISLEEAVYIIKRDTRHFAKRQLTWFRRERDVIWLDRQAYQDEASILEAMLCILREQNIYMAK